MWQLSVKILKNLKKALPQNYIRAKYFNFADELSVKFNPMKFIIPFKYRSRNFRVPVVPVPWRFPGRPSQDEPGRPSHGTLL